MRRRTIHDSDQAPKLTKYEEERLKRITSTREMMEAAGFKTCLANRAIFNQKVNVHEKNVEQDSECSDYEPEQNKECDSDEDQIFIQEEGHSVEGFNKGKKSENNKMKQAVLQSSTMGEFVNLRSRKKQALMVQQNKVTGLPRKGSTCQVQDGKEKKMLGMQKKTQIVRPGSVAMYLQMRKKQHIEKNNAGEMEKFCDEEPFDLEGTNLDFEQVPKNGSQTDTRSPFLEFSQNMNLLADHGTDESRAIEADIDKSKEVSTTKKAFTVKKTRGPTVLTEVHKRKFEDRPPIILNEYGQPIGPTTEACKELSRFLGTVAKDSLFAPLNYCDWSKFPSRLKEKIWNYVLEKYMIPKEGLEWVMTTVNTLWRVHKSRVKKQHYYAFDTEDERWKNRPQIMSDQQFWDLLQYWNMEEIEEESVKNKLNRQMHNDPHTMGPNSMACLRYELQQKDPNKHLPSQTQVYKESRKRTPGKQYLTNPDKHMENLNKMMALQTKQQSGEESTKDPYDEVMGKDKHKGYLPLYGRGVTKSRIQKKEKKSRYVFPDEFLKDIKANLSQEVAQDIASLVLSQIKAANPDINLVIPDFGVATKDPNGEQVERSSKTRSEQQGSNVQETNRVPTIREDNEP